ncbi:MAG: UDP-N-acetylmuramoyl-L-alanine--D-glutamate ligase [Treponema sp.]|jgi:UDP-N-acetylmuramoylalanine--D-glutamate ligase|nr:UDP-N-acetylmuramoyl-L-alanine--D-glutamate ligase [Treponema sp.]
MKIEMEQGMKITGSYSGMKITVMGLGLNGGGLESARYLAGKGALVTVTDMKDEKALAPSIEQLEQDEKIGGRIRYVLGRHETEDFASADMVIKNPGVRADSPYLASAKRIETDISLFLAASPARLIAVTGSKGKSGTASALHRALVKAREAGLAEGKACLGGNITVSPLRFLDTLEEKDDVVLELSSWQLGDLRLSGGGRGGTLKPRCAVITSIMPDHQDRYSGMEDYVNDKREIYLHQDKTDLTVAPADDEWGKSFLRESPGRVLPFSESPLPETTAGGWVSGSGPGFVRLCPGAEPLVAVPADPAIPGRSQKKNLLAAALALLDLGFPAAFVRESLGSFPGIEHRLELFHETAGIGFYNDSAATIPEAAAAAVEALAGNGEKSLVLVTGGTDKNLDYAPLVEAAARAKEIVLLEGSGSRKIAPLLRAAGIPFQGPFGNLEAAVTRAVETAGNLVTETAGNTGAGKAVCVVLSPGCASFGMFKNEFDRGRQWKETVIRLSRRFLRSCP